MTTIGGAGDGADKERMYLRRRGLMDLIVKGISKCVPHEHEAIYRSLRHSQPAVQFTANKYGVFYDLDKLDTRTLEECYRLIRHGIAQSIKEQSRLRAQSILRYNMTHGQMTNASKNSLATPPEGHSSDIVNKSHRTNPLPRVAH